MSKKYEISLIDLKAKEEIKDIDGLCTKRFHADLVTEDLDYDSLKEGDLIAIGEKRLLIQKVGKECFEDCPLPPEERPCILSRKVAFGKYIEKES